ncbi:MAG TPA: OmpH family outer membrane protein [Mucilaginibacter sp.]|nr:OmpH family outer membrane protein [Mucilaginibacter sp.]
MKKLLKVALVAVLFLSVGNFAKAQAKIGYINFDNLIGQMPEAKTVKSQLDIYSKQFTDELSSMQTEFQTKAQEYQKGQAAMTDATRTAKQAELQDIQKRIQDYQTSAQQKFDERSNELVKPLSDKARTAVETVAKEKGYTYVINTASTQFIVAPPGDDLMDAVKLKMGIK